MSPTEQARALRDLAARAESAGDREIANDTAVAVERGSPASVAKLAELHEALAIIAESRGWKNVKWLRELVSLTAGKASA